MVDQLHLRVPLRTLSGESQAGFSVGLRMATRRGRPMRGACRDEDMHTRRPSMNPYTTTGQARIQQRDIEAILQEGGFLAATHLAALERHRGYQAEAEVNWLRKQCGATPPGASSGVALVRQAIGAALVRAGECLAGGPR